MWRKLAPMVPIGHMVQKMRGTMLNDVPPKVMNIYVFGLDNRGTMCRWTYSPEAASAPSLDYRRGLTWAMRCTSIIAVFL
jgi:hypothetical protein